MNTPHNIAEDVVEQILKTDAAQFRHAYIDDTHFTSRVMDALPLSPMRNPLSSAHNPLSAKKRFAIILGMTTIAALFATTFLSSGNLLIDAYMDVATDTITPAVIALLTIMMMGVVGCVSASMSNR